MVRSFIINQIFRSVANPLASTEGVINSRRTVSTQGPGGAYGYLWTASPPILHRIFLPHAHFLFPTHHSKSRGNSGSNAQFQVVLQIRLIHFPRNSCRFLLELKCSVVIDKFSKPHERKRVFFLKFLSQESSLPVGGDP